MSTRLRRGLSLAVIAALSLSVGYVILGNGFLLLGGIGWLCRGTNTIQVDYRSAWTVWPGVVHARDLLVTVQDRNIQSSIRFDTAEVSIRLSELFRRVFHARSVRGHGFEFRFRHRVMPESAKLAAVLAKPPISGFEDPPIFEAGPPEPPIPEDRYRLWTIQLDDVDVSARDIWIEQFRYLGRARARGAFRLRPARQLWVGPASLDLEPGRLVARGQDAVANFLGRIECEVPFDVRIPTGLAVTRFISAKTDLHGDLVSGAGAEVYMKDDARVEPRGARLDAEVVMHEGILAPSGRIRLGGTGLSVRSDAVWAEIADPWELTATGDDIGTGGSAAFRCSTLSMHESACGSMSLGVSGLALELASSTRDTAVPWELERVHAGIRALAVDGRWGKVSVSGHGAGELTAATGKREGAPSEVTLNASATGVRVRSDSTRDDGHWSLKVPTLRASARLGEGLRGPFSVLADRVTASVGSTTMTFDVGADVRFVTTDLEARRASVGGYVDVRNAAISSGKRHVENWWANVRLDRMQLLLERGLEFAGRVSARLRDGTPGLLVLAEKDEIPDWLPSVLPLHDLSGYMDVQRRCRTIDVGFPRMQGGPLTGSGRIVSAPFGTKGALLLRWGGSNALTAGIDLGGGSSRLDPFAGDSWIDEKRAELDAVSARASAGPCAPTPMCGG